MNLYVSTLELTAFIVSLFCLKTKQPIYKLLCFILFITVINEWWLIPVFSEKRIFNRNEIYNAFSLLDMTVWFMVFYLIFQETKWKKFVIPGYIVVIIYSISELYFIKSWKIFHTDSMRLYSISIILCSSIYFYSKLKEEYYRLLSDPIFWICCACFFFHSLLFVNLTTQARPDYFKLENARRFFYILHNIGNTFFYLLLTASFILCYFRYYRKAPD